MLEKSFQTAADEQIFLANSTPQENTVVNNLIRNITMCKSIYKNFYGIVVDCLRQAFNYIKNYG